jgi:rhodanese-related sulfurtransferase
MNAHSAKPLVPGERLYEDGKNVRCTMGASWTRDVCIFLLLCGLSLGIGTAIDGLRTHAGVTSGRNTEAPQNLSFEQFRDRVRTKRGLILDARSSADFGLGHVPGAISFSANYIEGSYLRLNRTLDANKSQPITVYCVSKECTSAQAVQRELMRKGFSAVAVFPGGWRVWQANKMPVEKVE